jgi:hypothetical protein
MEYANVPDHF